MSRNIIDSFSTKTTRNDRFAQMSKQEQIIEQKKREIQARLQQKEKTSQPISTTNTNKTSPETKKPNKNNWKGNVGNKPNQNAINKSDTSTFNMFSNDGTFLDQFKQQMNDKKTTHKDKRDDKSYNEERPKQSRWSRPRTSSNNYDENPPKKISRFSDLSSEIPHERPPFNPPFQNEMYQPNFQIPTSVCLPPQTLPQPIQNLSNFNPVTSANLILPMTINVPPPQLNSQLLGPPPNIVNQNILNVPPPVISVPNQINVPPPCIQTVELTQIPAPNPIPVHTIPQPEPINTLTIPPPAPLQLQNIPSPSPIRLNEIPNPKPIDLMNIPAPDDPKLNKAITDPDFIKNVPPPNKSVPPPNLGVVTELPNISIPPPNATQNQILPIPPTSIPPPLPLPSTLTTAPQIIGLIQNQTNPVVTSIPSLMAQPILPPMSVQPMHTNVTVCQINLPPPVNVPPLPGPPPVLNQPPPLAQTQTIPPMNFPPPLQINAAGPPPMDLNQVCPTGSGSAGSQDAMVSLARMVAQCGPGIEDIVQQRSAQDPRLWFLFNKQSAAYQQYRSMVEQFRADIKKNDEYKPEDIYEPENATDDENDHKTLQDGNEILSESDYEKMERKRKRRSRWGEKVNDQTLVQPITTIPLVPPSQNKGMLTKLTRNDPGLIQYAINTFGSANLSEEDWNKCEDHYKINLLYQAMVKKREEIERLQRMGKNKYEYDSDEETDGGTWEHKLRMQEMEATQLWANELTRQAEGKHHIGDFLPPEELKKFMEKYTASKQGRMPNLSDYKEFKLKEDNIGFKMLQKLGWQEGQGLGTEGTGIVEPVNKGSLRDQNQGLGLESHENFENDEDEYTAYRRRMMLAYRFRPNPLNNPRRPYY